MSADLLTVTELGEILGGAEQKTVMEWRRLYQWPHVRIGRQLFFTPEHVAEITKKHTVVGGKVAPSDGRTAKSAARGKRPG